MKKYKKPLSKKQKKKFLKRYFSTDFLIKNFTHMELKEINSIVFNARFKATTSINLFQNSYKSDPLVKMPPFERIDGWQPLHLLNNESFSRD